MQETGKPSTSAVLSSADSNSDSSNSSFENEDDPQKKKRSGRRPLTKLNATLKGLMGEANLRYARGDIETAKKMCFEVMRQVPEAYEPYITLAQIVETTDSTKYEGYLAIASCLYPHDSSIWCRLAELHVSQNKLKEGILCYSKAIRSNPKNMSLHYKRLELVEKSNDSRFALACKKHMANKMPRKEYQTIIEICKEIAQFYHGEKQNAKALDVLQIPFKRIPKRITQDLVNMMLELLLATGRLSECLDIFFQYCNFVFEITVNHDEKITIDKYTMPEGIQIDLKVKFIVCLIKLECYQLVPPLIDEMIEQENVDEVGDLFLDVAEDLMAVKLSNDALKLLIPLVKSKTYNLAAVWLKYAECLYDCDLLEQAVEAYFTVMTMAPQHVEVLYPLAMTLLKLNKQSEALEVLSQDLSANKIDVAVLIERMKLLKQINDLDEYWKCAELLLSRHCVVLKYPEEIEIVLVVGTKPKERHMAIKERRSFRGDLEPLFAEVDSIREPSNEGEYKVYREILKFAMEREDWLQMQRFGFMGLTSKKFAPYTKDIMLACFFACVHNNDTYNGYNLIRYFLVLEKDNNLLWNLFNLILQNDDDLRHSRFISRLNEKLPNMHCLEALEANDCLCIGNYTTAMKFFMKEFRKHRSPYSAFMLGVTLLQCYSQRSRLDDKKKIAEIVTYLFLYYAQNRTKEAKQETFYNLGRMYHQLGIKYMAEQYYLKVLDCEEGPNEDLLSLKYEASYNLHLIYKNSGNLRAARNVLMNIVI